MLKKFVSLLVALIIMLASVMVPESVVLADSSSDVADFVTRLYSVCLDRNPDAGGLADWTNKLINHEATGCSAAYGFIFSPEFQSKECTNEQYITYMYEAFFGRNPDDAGFNSWVEILNNGATRESVFCGFANSNEFAALCSSYGIVRGFHIEGYDYNRVALVNLFVERLYSVVLQRPCDNGGMESWTVQLINRTKSGCRVAYGFFFSQEFLNRHLCNEHYVETLYQAFMGRSADEEGKAAWVSLLDNGTSREFVFMGFSSSQEFAGICNSYGIDISSMNLSGNTVEADNQNCQLCAIAGPDNETPVEVTPTPTPAVNPIDSDVTPVVTPAPTIPTAINLRGLITTAGNQYFIDDDGNFVTGWKKVDNRWYYFDKKTYAACHEWAYIGEDWFYFNDDGVMQTGWIHYNDHEFYLNTSGRMVTEWFKIDGYWYYFSPSSGRMQTDWRLIKGKWYYLDSTGRMLTGWNLIEGKWYFLYEDGSMAADTTIESHVIDSHGVCYDYNG